MREAVIIDALRTPVGRRNGQLSGWHPVDLAAHTLRELVDRNDVDPELIDDVIGGCVHQVGEQSLNITRSAVLGAGLPVTVPGTTVDRQCGSSQQAVHFAAQGVMAGAYDVAIAVGVESLSRVPMLSSAQNGPGLPFGSRMRERFGVEEDVIDQIACSDMIAEKWGLDREALDAFSLQSHARAGAAQGQGWFDREVIPVPLARGVAYCDEGIRSATDLAKLAALAVLREGGTTTAGNACQISDGAASVLIAERKRAEQLGWRPMAVIRDFALAGEDPLIMLTAVIPATQRLLSRSGLSVEDVDLFEINEAFASVVLAWMAEIRADPARVNPSGGAIALGHPVGCSGVRLLATLVHNLRRTGQRYGLQAMCEGGGTSNALLVENLV